ncbi:V-type ATPase 116kDa subunit family protein [Georgenia thermotolerans]|uniref:ATPase n=1 Tax=Georgenia thermotolerans TaxID=527326 RepID=A0A7J5UII5_9MICO|nr:V-type ATPase 116kDa subunit family protein [Georgenia thermotolerans]KAE8762172.1 ATPase [Georgenia thermotolerans]
MPWRDVAAPVRMQRVALVAPAAMLRDLLVVVADAGTVELDTTEAAGPGGVLAAGQGGALAAAGTGTTEAGGAAGTGTTEAAGTEQPRLSPTAPDPAELRRRGRTDLLVGEADLARHEAAAVVRGEVTGLLGWTPAAEVGPLTDRLAPVGAAVVPLAVPRGVDPPTLLRDAGVRRSFTPLVETYGTVPYADVDPSVLAAVAYMVMFGMMFGDVGHGALLVAGGLLLRAGRPRRLARFAKVWPFVVGSGVAAIGFGLLYGECFGPTGLVPVLWIQPLEEPITLLAVALGLGFVLLAVAQGVGTVNRWREGGWPLALSAPSGIAGAALLAGLGVLALGAVEGLGWVVLVGVLVMVGGVTLAFVGFLAASGGGGAGVTQAGVEVFDAVLRVGTNLVSFTRLAAFGLTHAALGQVVWDGTTTLWGAGGILVVAAVAVFVLGNALAFALEALVAGVQALRLEYYELFSRIFTGEGRPFRPWHVPTDPSAPATTGLMATAPTALTAAPVPAATRPPAPPVPSDAAAPPPVPIEGAS